MKKAILFGAGDLAKLVCRSNSFQQEPFDIIALAADGQYIDADSVEGIPLLDYERAKEIYPPESGVGFLVCIGYTNMNQERKRISEQIQRDGYSLLNFVDQQAIIRSNSIGTGNIFLEGCMIGSGSVVGNGNIFYPNALVAHDCIVCSYNYFAISSSVGGFTQIDDCCFIGNNATIRDNCHISSYSLIGAGAYADKNTSAYDVVVPERSHTLNGKTSLQMKL